MCGKDWNLQKGSDPIATRANILQKPTRITTSTLIASLTCFAQPACGLNLLDAIAKIATLAI